MRGRPWPCLSRPQLPTTTPCQPWPVSPCQPWHPSLCLPWRRASPSPVLSSMCSRPNIVPSLSPGFLADLCPLRQWHGCHQSPIPPLMSSTNSSRKPPNSISAARTIPHPSAHLLNRFRVGGAPVACSGTPWSFAQKAAALTRGPHQSALQHIPFLRQEFVDMIRKGQWTLLPARLVINDLQLRLSPLGVVPQRDRRPRTISD
jgi:hypothetical protein